jgi:ATP-dependent DNA ligase
MRGLDCRAVKLLTRTGLDWTQKCPAIVADRRICRGAWEAYLDGALCGMRRKARRTLSRRVHRND